MATNYLTSRIKPDKREAAVRAARVVLDAGVARKDAMERFGIGWVTLCAAIKKLRAERAAGSTP